MRTDAELVALIPEWLAFSRVPASVGLTREEAIEKAQRLCRILLKEVREPSPRFGDEAKDIAHALVRFVLPTVEAKRALELASAAYRWISALSWTTHESGERLDLLRNAADIGWQSIGLDLQQVLCRRKQAGDPDTEVAATKPMRCPSDESDSSTQSLSYLFAQCDRLARIGENDLPRFRSETEAMIENFDAERRSGLFDERFYFHGELARLAGVACRMEGLWDKANFWLSVAEADFAKALDPAVGFAKVAYVRLGLLYQHLRLTEVLENVRPLRTVFATLGLPGYAVKCQVAEAMALKQSSRFLEATTLFESLSSDPEVQRRPGVAARVHTHLADSYKELGRLAEAAKVLTKAGKHISRYDVSWTSADFRAVCADVLRNQGRVSEAVELFDRAKADYLAVGMVPLAAYIAVILAESNLMLGRAERAEAELVWALPILQEYKLLREGCAAVALLQESIKARCLDPRALRLVREDLKRKP